MNLIEKLGGYEAAKNVLHKLTGEGKDIVASGKTIIVANELSSALLEHRRQNNIFEVGDKVVSNTGSKIFKIDHIYNQYAYLDKGDGKTWRFNISDIVRHATDKEIAQGFRDE